METQLLATLEAAAVLNMTPAQIRTLVRKRQLPHVALPNGEIRFVEADLVAWIESHRQEAAPCK